MHVNHHTLGQLFTGLNAKFRAGFTLATPIWPAIAMEVPSNTEKERYDWLGVVDGMHEWVDDRVINGVGTHKYEIENRDWAQTIEVDRNKMEDDTHGIYSPLSQKMGESAALHPDELVFGAINNGRTGLGYDGVAFFSASHPCTINPAPPDHPGTQSNLHSDGAGPYWYLADLSSMLKPLIYQRRKAPQFVSKNAITDDSVFYRRKFLMGADARYNVGYGFWQQMFASNRELTEANVEAAIVAMQSLVADNGKPMNFSPTHVIVPTTLQFAAKRIFAPEFVPSGDAGATITNIHRGAMQIIVSKHLDRT